MDFGLIILIIIASIIGNIIKQSKKRRTDWNKPNNPYTRSGTYTSPQNKSSNRMDYSYKDQKSPENILQDLADSDIQKIFDPYRGFESQREDLDYSLEDKRIDIGKSYESEDMPSYSSERSSLEDNGLENTEVVHFSYEDEMEVEKEKANSKNNDIKVLQKNDRIKLNFNEDSLINGIIMAEVLSPPKCRR